MKSTADQYLTLIQYRWLGLPLCQNSYRDFQWTTQTSIQKLYEQPGFIWIYVNGPIRNRTRDFFMYVDKTLENNASILRSKI